ncbi:hypothetical protein REPUB_Repub08aG0167000 [Reevesia pubescens]
MDVLARSFLNKRVFEVDFRSPVWKFLWQANVLPKVKYFAWRLFWGFLPTASVLCARGIGIANVCAVCGFLNESIFHVFFECHFSRSVWMELCPWLLPCLDEWQESSTFWFQLLTKAVLQGHLDTVLFSLWLIWANRNKCFHLSANYTPSGVCRLVFSLLSETRTAHAANSGVLDQLLRWIPPRAPEVKLNVDASFCAQNGVAGLGSVLRDCGGNILSSAVTKERLTQSVLHAEVKAILFGLRLVFQQGYEAIVVESDSSLAVTEVSKKGDSFWDGNAITLEILRFARLFVSCRFEYVKRQANHLAHSLASLDCLPGHQRVWMGCLPIDVCNCVS